jgi:DNA polymerase-3 subunit alpha
LLCQSRAGYLRLADWLTRAYRTNQHRGRAEMKRAWFAEGTDGLIALSGFAGGDVGHALAQGNPVAARAAADAWARLFPDRFYLEVQRAGRSDDDALTAASVRLAAERSLPVVAPIRCRRPAPSSARTSTRCTPRLRPSDRGGRNASRQQHLRRRMKWRRLQICWGAGEQQRSPALSDASAGRIICAFPTPEGVSLEQH